MALRRREKNDRQLNRGNVRRPGGRTAEFFDLRETDMNTGSDRNAGYGASGSSTSYGRYRNTAARANEPDSGRPYRERHRVEVNTQGNYNYRDNYRADDRAESFGVNTDRSGGQQRIVHGNVPGNRTGQTGNRQREEAAPDLIYESGRSYRGRGRENRSAVYPPGRTPARAGSAAYRPYERDYMESPAEDLSEYEDYLYEDETEYPNEERSDNREVLGRRLRQRAESRKLREQQLRSLYLKIGAGAAVLLLLIILIVPRIFSGSHSGKKEAENREQGQAVAQAQDSTGSDDQEQVKQEDGTETAADEEAVPGQDLPAEENKTGAALDGSPAVQTQEEDSAAKETQGQGIVGTETPQAEEGTAGTAEEQPAGTENQAPQNQNVSDTPVSVPGTPAQTAAASGLYERQDDWRFILVNPWYTLPEEYVEVATSSLPNGESVDTRCFSDFVKMLDDCRAAGGEPVVCSSYRPHAKQVTLFEDQVKSLMGSGMSREQAEIEAGTTVAVPGTSEHELGLAADICDYKYQNLDDAQGDTATQKWLMEHSWEYGFILRYPRDKTDITGIIYEPWHYRYVGKEAAEEITQKGICLEEYLARQQ